MPAASLTLCMQTHLCLHCRYSSASCLRGWLTSTWLRGWHPLRRLTPRMHWALCGACGSRTGRCCCGCWIWRYVPQTIAMRCWYIASGLMACTSGAGRSGVTREQQPHEPQSHGGGARAEPRLRLQRRESLLRGSAGTVYCVYTVGAC